MRTVAILVAIFALAPALFTRNWASVSSGREISVGLWDYSFTTDQKWAMPLSELTYGGTNLESNGMATLIAGVAAIAAMLAAAVLVRKPRSLALRVGLCVPLAASLGMTVRFVAVIRTLEIFHIGWAPYLALGGCTFAGIAIAWPQTAAARSV